MHQLEAREHAPTLEHVDDFQDLRGGQAEDAAVTPALGPHPLGLGGELHAHTDVGDDAESPDTPDDLVHFARPLDHDDDVQPELDPEEGEVGELPVLIAVADDVRLGVVHVRQGRDEFRLAAGLQAVVVLGPEVAHLVDHLLLVDLDWVDPTVASLVAGVADRLQEALAQVGDRGVQDSAEAQQHRRSEAARLDVAVDSMQADGVAPVAAGEGDRDLSFKRDVEVPVTPGADAVRIRDGLRFEGVPVSHRVGAES